uniref:Uncharacterized protein n=2 Tax=Ralstonia TaxID=48736 RepID=C6BNP8_RALP1
MKSVKYLDAVIERHGLKTDKALCEHMGWSHSAVNNYRKGLRIMDNEQCLRVALELGMENPLPIIMAADADRAERAGQRSLWEVFSPRMAHSGLVALLVSLGLGVTNFVTPSPAEAAPLSHSSAPNTLCYVKSPPDLATSTTGAACNPDRHETGNCVTGNTSANPTPLASRRLHPAGVFYS